MINMLETSGHKCIQCIEGKLSWCQRDICLENDNLKQEDNKCKEKKSSGGLFSFSCSSKSIKPTKNIEFKERPDIFNNLNNFLKNKNHMCVSFNGTPSGNWTFEWCEKEDCPKTAI